MKLVVRIDDVGYSKVCNIGAFETLDHGIATSADVMLDTPGSEDALRRLRDYPWISVGWHTHFWGAPLLGAAGVPSMYDAARGGFRTDLYEAEDVSFDEALAECRAQIGMCRDILGKVPDVGGCIKAAKETPFVRALMQVHRENGIVTDFAGLDLGPNSQIKVKLHAQDPRWTDRRIYFRGLNEYCEPLRRAPLNEYGWTDSLRAVNEYDPIRYYTEDQSGLLGINDGSITVHAWHPGYVDYYVYKHGDTSPGAALCFKEIRVVDAHALCSDEVKSWMKTHRIELINMRDALYGTSEYQEHLRSIASPLSL